MTKQEQPSMPIGTQESQPIACISQLLSREWGTAVFSNIPAISPWPVNSLGQTTRWFMSCPTSHQAHLENQATLVSQKGRRYCIVSRYSSEHIKNFIDPTLSSSSSMLYSVSYASVSSGKPVIFNGPFGIKITVNLNWATDSPGTKIIPLYLVSFTYWNKSRLLWTYLKQEST